MESCHRYQALMLDSLYGLLDEAERQRLQAHLDECGTCPAALIQAQEQQKLIASTARLEFPNVTFRVPPAEAPTALSMPARLARARWVPWAIAASLLFAVSGLGLPGLWYWQAHQADGAHQKLVAQAERIAKEYESTFDRARKDVESAKQKLRDLPAAQQKKWNDLLQATQSRPLNVVVSGPPALQPGAPNEYRIQAVNRKTNQPAPADVRVRVLANNAVVYEQAKVTPRQLGDYRVSLPPTLAVKPESRLVLEVSARQEGGAEGKLSEELDLASPLYVTYLTTDKPIYRPGERVRFRSLTLERFSLKPPREDFQLIYTLKKPSGEEAPLLRGNARLIAMEGSALLHGPDKQPIRGLGAGEWEIDTAAPGGEYTLSVSEGNQRFPSQQRKFLVNHYQLPQLNKELEFSRKSYGPGESASASCKVVRREGGAGVAGKPATVAVQIDGKTYGPDGKENGTFPALTTDAAGAVIVAFQLPAAIERGVASLSVTFTDDANIETIVRPIPIALKRLQVEFFPEGGDLVAGVPNRVYFQARTTLDKPAELKGRLLDGSGQPLPVEVQTLNDAEHPGVNQGMGVFEFTPIAGQKYGLAIDEPIGIQGRYPLPEVKDTGVVLSIPSGVTTDKEPIRAMVHSAAAQRSLLVGAYCRGRLLDHQKVTAKKGEATAVDLRPEPGVGGVYRVTVFEEQPAGNWQPVAERLVYRQPVQRLNLSIQPDKKAYTPGGQVKLTIQATNEKDQPAPAVVMVAVVDKSALVLADDKSLRAMPSHFQLTSEVRHPEDLEDADFLLSDHPKARRALDLLLGTQGWRRFAEQRPEEFRKKHQDDAQRLLVMNGLASPVPKVFDLSQCELERARAGLDAECMELQEQLSRSVAAQDAVRQLPEELSPLREESESACGCYAIATQRLETYRGFVLPVLGVLLLLAALASLVVGMLRQLARSTVYYTAAACSLLLFGVVLAGLYGTRDGQFLALRGPNPGDLDGRVSRLGDRLQLRERLDQEPNPAMMPAEVRAGAQKHGANALPPLAQGMMQPRAMKPLAMRAAQIIAPAGLKGMADRGPLMMVRPKALAKQMEQARELKPRAAGDRAREAFRADPAVLVVREYAHQRPRTAASETRSDFTETVYWHPVLVLPDGKGEVAFDLCDSVTTFQVTMHGHTLDGRLGAVTHTLASRLPFSLEPKAPIEVCAGDRIDLPVSIANNTPAARDVQLQVTPHGLTPEGKNEDALTVPADGRARRVYRFRPDMVEGEAAVEVQGRAGPFADRVRRSFRVVPAGFPIVGAHSDLLEGVAQSEIALPDTWVKGTLKCQVQVYPSPLAALQQGLEALLREPHGCFEQTSTSNYPNLLVLDYLKEARQSKPEVERRARELLAQGYERLTSFECQNPAKKQREGYEWFGGTVPAHEALTAYGLLQFRDMARVYDVDPKMLQRTQAYLLARKDGNGGFQRNPRALDSFGHAPADITNAYIVWALTESGKYDDVTRELNTLAAQAKTSKDPYFLALVANSLLNRGQHEEADTLLKTIAATQKPDGHLDAERTSITGSGGQDLQIETTALAVLGWLKAHRPEFALAARQATNWLVRQRGGAGGFGSTQSTILTLKALIAYARDQKKTAEAGAIDLFIGQDRVGRLNFPANAQEVLALTVPDPEKLLKSGKNPVRVEITGKNAFPYTLTWSYQTLQPASADNCPIRLTTRLDREAAQEGETVHLNVLVENVSGKGQGMAVAVVGLPGGLMLPEDLKQLRDHARLRNDGSERGLISMFELRGRELVLYWRDLAPEQKIDVPLDLVCRVPGEYTGPASRAYLYYNADLKHWVQPLALAIRAKE